MNNPLFEFESDIKYVCYEEFVKLRDNLQTQIDDINHKKNVKVVKIKEVSPEIKAIQLHYEQNKTNQDVINNIRRNMNGLGYAINKNQNIPTSLLRMECLKLFNALSTEQKQQYFTIH